MRSYAPALLSLLCWLPALGQAGGPTLPLDSTGTFLGVETCGSSQCHDSPEAWRNATVLMQERPIWEHTDPHASAAASLRSARGRAIASALGLGPAAQAGACLACHGTPVPKAQQGPLFRGDAGVVCEACHGAGGHFLSTHVQPTSTHAGNLAAGMYPTTEPLARAVLCTSCHLGDEKRRMTHTMYAAGHPRLRFEHDTFLGLWPAHARVDADYRRRKPVASHAGNWAAGQLAAARTLLARLGRRGGAAGPFPELSLFECQACHRPATARAEGPLQTTPGLSDTPLRTLPVLAGVLAPGLRGEVAALPVELHRALGQQEALVPALAMATATLARLEQQLSMRPEQASDGLCLSIALAGLSARDGALPHATAEVLAMSLSSLLLGEQEAGRLDPGTHRRLASRVDALYLSLQDPEQYRPARFAEPAAALHRTLTPLASCSAD